MQILCTKLAFVQCKWTLDKCPSDIVPMHTMHSSNVANHSSNTCQFVAIVCCVGLGNWPEGQVEKWWPVSSGWEMRPQDTQLGPKGLTPRARTIALMMLVHAFTVAVVEHFLVP